MPIYDYRCNHCGREDKDVFAKMDEVEISCKTCGKMSDRLISVSYRVIPDLEPYFDVNLDSHIKSRRHRESVMKDKGVSEKFGKGWF